MSGVPIVNRRRFLTLMTAPFAPKPASTDGAYLITEVTTDTFTMSMSAFEEKYVAPAMLAWAERVERDVLANYMNLL